MSLVYVVTDSSLVMEETGQRMPRRVQRQRSGKENKPREYIEYPRAGTTLIVNCASITPHLPINHLNSS